MDVHRLVRALVLLVGLFLAVIPRVAGAAEADYPVQNGWFYSQAGGSSGLGYTITDDGGVGFWREYRRLGGPTTLGYPASWRFVGEDGFVYQATQAGLLQWRPEEDRAVLANTFDLLSAASKDGWLRSARAIPRPIADDGSAGILARAIATRLSWLDDPGISQAYFASPNPAERREWTQQEAIELYGLPTSRSERIGPFVVQRFQRVAFQRWVEAVPGMPPPGSVVRVLGGDLLKEAGLLPGTAVVPAAPGSLAARIDPALSAHLDTLGDTAVGKPLRDLALAAPLSVVWAPLPSDVGAMFSARRRWLAVNVRWHQADGRSIAALLAHELSHLKDFAAERPIWTRTGCFDTEQAAFRVQADVWQELFGPQGRVRAASELDRQHNYVLASLRRDPDAFAARVVQTYQHECGDLRA